jgi:membrane protein DedA with SNARE-associated domain
VTWLIEAIKSNGSLSIFLGGIFEEIIVPIPSPLVSMAGGAFLVTGGENIVLTLMRKVVLPFSLGATIGSSLVYLLSYYGGEFLVEKMKKYLGFDWQMVEKTRDRFIKGSRDELAIVLLRGIPVVPVSLISAVCGAVQIKWKEFYLYTFLGLTIRSFILGFLGWQAGATYQTLVEGIDRIESFVFVLTFLVFLGLLGLGYCQREKIFH